MGQCSIPVDLFNPGQVFACMGFLEAAHVLLGDAEGGFDWSNETQARFKLRAKGNQNPFGVVLDFLSNAQLYRVAPDFYTDPSRAEAGDGPLCTVDTFPAPEADPKVLPLRLEWNGVRLDVTHWCDASSRNSFKLFAGTQRGASIARQMLHAVRELWNQGQQKLTSDPLGATVPLGGSTFKFDARKAWTTIDAGYSPDEQGNRVHGSPVVEMLAAVGLEHARPNEFDVRKVRYGVWMGLLPPVLARPLLGGAHLGIPIRMYRFTLALAGKNKNITFGQEETAP